jgi:polar amino acid transport system permease protein
MEFDFSVISDHARFLASGVGVTLALAGLSCLSSLTLGFIMALLRLYGPAWLRGIVVLYIDSMRAIPVLVVLVWTFFALPLVTGITMPPFIAALIGLTLHLAAYAAEIVRAGVQSVRSGQTRAALALGMSGAQIVRRIILPQAIVRMLPAFGSIISITIKDTAIASVIAVPELTYGANWISTNTFRIIEVYSVVTPMYLVTGWTLLLLLRRLERRFALRRA